jgi:hypothetical protein
MPKCVSCDKFFHPDMSVLMRPGTEDKACKCVFCYTGKSEITVEEENGKPSYKVTKNQAIENYRIYVAKLKDDPKVSKVLTGNAKSKFEI